MERFKNAIGFTLFLWYIGLRWMIFYHESWVYKPVNLLTAFISIWFITLSLFAPYKLKHWVYYMLAIILFGRNIIYTIEDVIDYHINPAVQNLCIFIDILMIVYLIPFIKKYIDGNYDEL